MPRNPSCVAECDEQIQWLSDTKQWEYVLDKIIKSFDEGFETTDSAQLILNLFKRGYIYSIEQGIALHELFNLCLDLSHEYYEIPEYSGYEINEKMKIKFIKYLRFYFFNKIFYLF